MDTTTSGSETARTKFESQNRSPGQRVQHVLHAHPALSPAVILLIVITAFSFADSRVLNATSVSLLLQQTAVIALLAIGQTVVILTAGIDLSAGAICIMATMVMAKLASESGISAILAIGIGILIAALGGLINGLLVTRLKLPPFIVTLGMLSVFTALGLLYSGGTAIQAEDLPSLLNWTGTVVGLGPLKLTTGVMVTVAAYLLFAFVLSQTAWGTHAYAVGDDLEAARLSGVNSTRLLVSVYLVAGVIYGLTAWVLIGRAGAASPNALTDANLESITAVVIGGTSLFGGRGGVIGTLLGALIIGVFSIGLSLIGVDNLYRVLAVGLLVIAAVSVDQWIRRAGS